MKYLVKLERMAWEQIELAIEADDEDEAETKAARIVNGPNGIPDGVTSAFLPDDESPWEPMETEKA